MLWLIAAGFQLVQTHDKICNVDRARVRIDQRGEGRAFARGRYGRSRLHPMVNFEFSIRSDDLGVERLSVEDVAFLVDMHKVSEEKINRLTVRDITHFLISS